MQKTDKRELFETMPVRKAIAQMAVPTVISQLITLIYNVVDTFFIGRTGNTNMIAGVGVAFTLYVLTISFSNLYGVGGGSLMARLIGRGETERARNVGAYSFYGAIAIALAYSLIAGVLGRPLLSLLGASDATMPYAAQYLYIVVVAGNVPIILSAAVAHLLRNVGYSRQASIGLSLGGVLNIVLDPIFMFVLLPDGSEVIGAAVATLIANTAACTYLVIVYRKKGDEAPLSASFSRARAILKEDISGLYNVGIPSAILTGLFDLANMVLNSLMSSFGDAEVAALNIVMKAERLPNAINVGICQGILPIIAYNYSNRNHKRMNDVINNASVIGLIISAGCVGLFELFAPQVTGVFLSASSGKAAETAKTLALAASFLRIRCLASPLQFMNYRSSFCMQAMGNGKGTLTHACMRELVFYIPFMFLLKLIFGRTGLVSALIAGEGCGMLFALYLLRRWMKNHVDPA